MVNNMQASRSAAKVQAHKNGTRKLVLMEEEKATKQQVDAWFSKFDHDTNGHLDKNELKELLTSLAEGKIPTEGVLDKAWTPYAAGGKGISKAEASAVVTKTVQYIKEQDIVEPLFAKYDTDGSGGLNEDELLKLLQRVAKLSGVDADAVATAITKEDVAHVLEMADADGSGKIEREEVLYACARWKAVYLPKFLEPPQPKSSACALL